ncbi:MAG: Fic family protein [Planctomycetota bacterium]
MLGRHIGLAGIVIAAAVGWSEETLPTPDLAASFEDQVRQTALRALEANQALLAERATLYTGPEAPANLAVLRARVDDLDALLTQSAGLVHELIWIGRERAQTARLMNGGPVEIAEANRIRERLALEEARMVEALIQTSDAMQRLNEAYPEAGRFLELDPGLDMAMVYTELPPQVATPNLAGGTDAALAQIAETFADVDGAIERAREGIVSGSTPAYALTKTAEAVLESLYETDPTAAGLAELDLERWRNQEENRRTAMAVAEVGLLAGAVFTGGTLSSALALGSGAVSVGMTADYMVDAYRTRTLADTHPDQHAGLVSQREARDATLDAVVAGALTAANAALVVRGARTLARPTPEAPAVAPRTASGPQKGLAQALDPDAPLGGARVSAATDESLPMGERMAAGVREVVEAPILPESAEALSARAAFARRQADRLTRRGVDFDDEALLTERMAPSQTVRAGDAVAEANFREADALVRRWVEDGSPLTLERIQELNRILGRDLPHNGFAPGRLRAPGEDVMAGVPTKSYLPGDQVAASMDEFLEWYRAAEASGMEPIELAARTYQRLVSVHPFADANGRTSRLVMDYVLRSHGLPPAAMEDVNVAAFGLERALGFGSSSVSPTVALERVTAGVERSLDILGR